MTTPISQEHTPDAARKQLPPVEERDREHAQTEQPAAEQLLPPITVPRHPPELPADEVPTGTVNPPTSGFAKSVGHWIHNHRDLPKHGVGFLGYQFIRSAIASIPYGLSMAGVLAGLTGTQKLGAKLAKEGSNGFMKGLGRNLEGFAGFQPAKNALLIGASFTLYRGTSKLGKWMTEYLFNPKDSEERTAQKVDDLIPEAIRKVKEIAPAESNSTPVSAIVLGFLVAAFVKPYNAVNAAGGKVIEAVVGGKKMNVDWTRDNYLATKGFGNKLKLLYGSLTPPTKFVQHAIINTFAYSLFFELGDRLYKDVQIRRGVWPGEHNSIKALKAPPDEYAQGIQDRHQKDAPKYEDSAAEAKPEKSHHPFFTSEPSVGRFLFRRVLPTALGITAYTAVKMRWGTMFGNNFVYDKGVTLKEFGKKAFGEGAATSLFFLIPLFAEPFEKWYDSFFAKLDKAANAREHQAEAAMMPKPLTPHQQEKYDELLTRVNTKEKAAANEAAFAQRA